MCHKNICYDSKLTCVLSPGSMSHINIYYVQQMQHVLVNLKQRQTKPVYILVPFDLYYRLPAVSVGTAESLRSNLGLRLQ